MKAMGRIRICECWDCGGLSADKRSARQEAKHQTRKEVEDTLVNKEDSMMDPKKPCGC